MVPETEVSETIGFIKTKFEKTTVNVIDAAASGAGDGLKLALNVGAMVLAFLALIALLNGFIGWVGGWFGYGTLTFQQILGWLLSPVAWLLGIPWSEAVQAGALLGEKTVLNEFVAYAHLQEQMTTLSTRTVTILTYALCGFANFGQIAHSAWRYRDAGSGAAARSRPSRSACAHRRNARLFYDRLRGRNFYLRIDDMRRKLSVFFGTVFVLLGVLMLFLGNIVKGALETFGPKVIGVPVHVETVRVNPLTGMVYVRALSIGNPEGFNTPTLMTLDEFKLDLSFASLFTDTLVIKRVLVEGPEVTYEKSLTSSNIETLQKKLANSDDKSGKKVIIE